MGSKLNRLRVVLGCQLRNITSYILFRLTITGKSRSLAPSHKSAIVFSPHQDDETLGCGGMIALKRQLGVPVKVVFMTDGRFGIPKSEPEEVILIRQHEAVAALGTLGVTHEDIHFLDRVDGTLANLPASQRQQLIDKLTHLLQTFKPEEVYVPHHKDAHDDHEATYKLVHEAIAATNLNIELWQYPIWLFWQSPFSIKIKSQDIAGAYSLAIDSVQTQKHQAIETYKSQIPGLTRGFLKRFFSPYELFFKNQ